MTLARHLQRREKALGTRLFIFTTEFLIQEYMNYQMYMNQLAGSWAVDFLLEYCWAASKV